MGIWGELSNELVSLLKLRTLPVAIKSFEKMADMDGIPELRRIDRFLLICQIPALVMSKGWTVGITAEDNIPMLCTNTYGFVDSNQDKTFECAEVLASVWFSSFEDAMKQQMQFTPAPKKEAMVFAPLAADKFDPDIVLVYGMPSQIMFIVSGLQKIKYDTFQFFFKGEGSCADPIAQCYTKGKPVLSIPGWGERRFGAILDAEMVVTLPGKMVGTAVQGIRELYSKGIRYPIPVFGPEGDPTPVASLVHPMAMLRHKARKEGRNLFKVN